MKYNPHRHIKGEMLADMVGVESRLLYAFMRKHDDAPAKLGSVAQGRSTFVFYDRKQALAWAERLRAHEPDRNIVPPRQPVPLRKQGVYRPSPQMRMNMARAGELYQHRLYIPDGIGNSREFAPGFDRGRA